MGRWERISVLDLIRKAQLIEWVERRTSLIYFYFKVWIQQLISANELHVEVERKLGHSTYGTNLVAEDIPVLFTVDKRRIRDFSLSFIFTRIIGFFLAPALLTNWFTKICYLVEDRSGEYAADPELIKWYENWHRLSNFVYNGGKAEVEDRYLLTICSLMPVR